MFYEYSALRPYLIESNKNYKYDSRPLGESYLK